MRQSGGRVRWLPSWERSVYVSLVKVLNDSAMTVEYRQVDLVEVLHVDAADPNDRDVRNMAMPGQGLYVQWCNRTAVPKLVDRSWTRSQIWFASHSASWSSCRGKRRPDKGSLTTVSSATSQITASC